MQETKDLYTETTKCCKIKLKRIPKNIKASRVHELEDNVVKISILHKAIHTFNAISIKTPMKFFGEIEKYSLKLIYGISRSHK